MERLVREYFPKDYKRAIAVFTCESGLTQWKADGTVREGPTQDFGLTQIHEPSHGERAAALGLDYKNSIHDNLELARMLYDAEGWTPWVCAWSKDHLALVKRSP